MPLSRSDIGVGCRLVTAMVLGAWGHALPGQTAGAIITQVQCSDDAKQSYALYLPLNYTPERAWPILYCFDAVAQGRRPVERFQQAAEQYGYIVVGSNNSRNGPWANTVNAANAILRDTHRRFHLDRRRCYAAGCSGGARAACLVAAAEHFAGVISCSGGFPRGAVPKQVAFAFFGSAGRADFNYREMMQAEAALAAQHVPHHLAIFDGGHEWLPASLAVEALGWMELQAMRAGLRPRDDALIGALFRRRLQNLAGEPVAGEAFRGYLAAVADFDGLTDISEPAAKAAALKDTKAVREHFRAEKKAEQQEQRWLDRIYDAAELARRRARPPAADALPLEFQPGRGSFVAAGSDFGQEPRSDVWTRWDFDREAAMRAGADRYDALRDVVGDLGRQAETSVVARRALNGAFATYVTDGWLLLDRKDSAAAVESLEIAAIIRPEMPMTYAALANAHVLRGEKREAREALQAAIAKGFDDQERISQMQKSLAP